jgi:3-oxoacyl-[acyl-carrier protein] reductase
MRYILVTGGAKNLGKNICLALAKNGYFLIIHYKDSKKEAQNLKDLVEKKYKIKAHIIFGDFSKKETLLEFCEKVKSKYKNIFGLINNVGNYKLGSFEETGIDDIYDLVQVNTISPLIIIKELINNFSKKAKIINIGICGLENKLSNTTSSAYMMSKASLLMMTKSFAKSLLKKGILVNMISPGYLGNSIDMPNIENLPMKRVCSFDEVSNVILFLLDDKNAYITGQNIEIAGGVRL